MLHAKIQLAKRRRRQICSAPGDLPNLFDFRETSRQRSAVVDPGILGSAGILFCFNRCGGSIGRRSGPAYVCIMRGLHVLLPLFVAVSKPNPPNPSMRAYINNYLYFFSLGFLVNRAPRTRGGGEGTRGVGAGVPCASSAHAGSQESRCSLCALLWTMRRFIKQ